MTEPKKPCPNVSVLARFRPMNNLEITNGSDIVCDFRSDTELMFNSTKEKNQYKFAFDRIFDPRTIQNSVYEFGVKGIIDSVLDGYNGTVLAYGQTASGKTYTMQGDVDSDENMGIIPRMISHVFDHIYEAPPENEFMVKVSMLEIYQEKIRDLIETEKINLNIREDPTKGIYIEDISEHYVASPEEVVTIMKIGTDNRAQACTNMNEHSSRSHSIFVMTITQNNKKSLVAKTGKLYLVDLAGSEKISKTGATGHTLEEAKIINKSLTTLGMVINSLTDGKSTHVPYRESKLTRVLQESLGGNSKTCLIITCSPSIYNESESLSTLRFGERAKKIKNKPHINKEVTVAELQVVIQNLESQLAKANKRIYQLETFIQKNNLQVPSSEGYELPNDLKQNKNNDFNNIQYENNDDEKNNVIDEQKIADYLAKMDGSTLSLTEKIINTIGSLKESEELSENKTEIIAQLMNIKDNYETKENDYQNQIKELEEERDRLSEKLRFEIIEKATLEEEQDEKIKLFQQLALNPNISNNKKLELMKTECCSFVNQLKFMSSSNNNLLKVINEFQEKIISLNNVSSNDISREIQEEIISPPPQLQDKLLQTDVDSSEIDALKDQFQLEKEELSKVIGEKDERAMELESELDTLKSTHEITEGLIKNDQKQNVERILSLESNLIELRNMLMISQTEKNFFESDNKKLRDIANEKILLLEKLEKEKEDFKERNLLRGTLKNNVIPVLKGGNLKNSMLVDSRIEFGKSTTTKY